MHGNKRKYGSNNFVVRNRTNDYVAFEHGRNDSAAVSRKARFMPGATILVVDDSPEILQQTTSALEEAGYAVVQSGGGQHAMALLGGGQMIDLLLTDVRMPGGIDGFELARRAHALHPSLFVVYLTGHFDEP